MNTSVTRRAFVAASGLAALATAACASHVGGGQDGPASTSSVDELMGSLSVEQKIAQLIMPAIRTWEGEDANVTDLSAVPDLAAALRRHQYGGVILFGQNVVDTEQTVRLVSDLQANNLQSDDAKATYGIPYLVAADQEGGSVSRLTMGTRGTGSMAIGATGDDASKNAMDTGTVFGKELGALGINVNFGPCADIIGDLADPGMSTRVFSDDPDVVTQLCKQFAAGAKKGGVITTFKHFPGAGDGDDDPTAIRISLDDLQEKGLKVFGDLVANDADMIMVSATTFPSFDDTYALGDGKTKGYYPACMSCKIVTNMLRGDLGFGGVVVTDALEMKQFVEEPDTKAMLLPGDPKSVEHQIAVAERCLAAGCDILLMPADLKDDASVTFYDELISGLSAKVRDGSIDQGHLDESVRRVLSLKQKYELLVPKDQSVDAMVAAAKEVVGSDAHHGIERSIAEHAVTMLKGDGVLPLEGSKTRLVIVGRTKADANPIGYALSELMEKGKVDPQAYVDNRLTGSTDGSADSATNIFVDCYYDADGDGKLAYSDELSAAIAEADAVVCLSAVGAGIDALQDANPCMQGIGRALKEAHAAGAEFVLLSDNLPVDAARFSDADAIVCAYLSAGFAVDPKAEDGSKHMGGINANVPAAIRAIFGMGGMPGALPIDVKMLKKGKDGKYSYTNEVLYARGSAGGKD